MSEDDHCGQSHLLYATCPCFDEMVCAVLQLFHVFPSSRREKGRGVVLVNSVGREKRCKVGGIGRPWVQTSVGVDRRVPIVERETKAGLPFLNSMFQHDPFSRRATRPESLKSGQGCLDAAIEWTGKDTLGQGVRGQSLGICQESSEQVRLLCPVRRELHSVKSHSTTYRWIPIHPSGSSLYSRVYPVGSVC